MQGRLRTCFFRRAFSFSSSPAHSHQAASPTNTSTNQNLRLSAFTGKPSYYEALYFFDDILLRLHGLPRTTSFTAASSLKWQPKEQMSDALGFGLDNLQYRKVREKLAVLAGYGQIEEVSRFLANFLVKGSTNDSAQVKDSTATALTSEPAAVSTKSYYGRVDKEGRAIATGKRKAATAKAMLVPGTGQLFVNGRPMTEYFSRWCDRFALAEPFRVTNTFGKFNVWGLVRGGGQTGQAGALSLAISKAMVVAKPELVTILSPWGLLRQDNRQVERKKPGQPKARKKFTWVKR